MQAIPITTLLLPPQPHCFHAHNDAASTSTTLLLLIHLLLQVLFLLLLLLLLFLLFLPLLFLVINTKTNLTKYPLLKISLVNMEVFAS
jgi:hypothetical protein